MAQNTSFMEWLEQTRRISKTVDQICMSTIDSIIHGLHILDKSFIHANKNFFDRFCTYYHKPNPVKLIGRIRKSARPRCYSCRTDGSFKNLHTKYVQESIDRCWQGLDMVQIQWFEIIDFMFERPQLVNPNAIDEYIANRITDVCRNNKKLNPLKNGTAKRFGKMWRGSDGKWRKERRRRF